MKKHLVLKEGFTPFPGFFFQLLVTLGSGAKLSLPDSNCGTGAGCSGLLTQQVHQMVLGLAVPTYTTLLEFESDMGQNAYSQNEHPLAHYFGKANVPGS